MAKIPRYLAILLMRQGAAGKYLLMHDDNSYIRAEIVTFKIEPRGVIRMKVERAHSLRWLPDLREWHAAPLKISDYVFTRLTRVTVKEDGVCMCLLPVSGRGYILPDKDVPAYA